MSLLDDFSTIISISNIFQCSYLICDRELDEFLVCSSASWAEVSKSFRKKFTCRHISEPGCTCRRKKAKERAAHPVQKKLPSMDRVPRLR